jgi:hypothetical protein
MKRSVLDYIADAALIAVCVVGAALILTPFAKAQEPETVCDWNKALALLATDKRFGKPITATDKTAFALAAVANLNLSKQAMIVPMYGATPEQLKLVILICGPNETWTPRHFIIDAEAERRFYDLAPPPPPVETTEQPKAKKRTRRADP